MAAQSSGWNIEVEPLGKLTDTNFVHKEQRSAVGFLLYKTFDSLCSHLQYNLWKFCYLYTACLITTLISYKEGVKLQQTTLVATKSSKQVLSSSLISSLLSCPLWLYHMTLPKFLHLCSSLVSQIWLQTNFEWDNHRVEMSSCTLLLAMPLVTFKMASDFLIDFLHNKFRHSCWLLVGRALVGLK